LVEAIEHGRIPTEEIDATFEAAYARGSGAVIGEDDVLRTFSTPEHVAMIEKFRELTANFRNHRRLYFGKVVGTYQMWMISSDDPVGCLRHELQKKSRHKPVRQLIQRFQCMMTLAPCL